ncbi:MAG: hypothetical protein IMF11_16765 [Proteobacteria bacterium]|nr:hypothetical protein [Pseudomonadota bacterium]
MGEISTVVIAVVGLIAAGFGIYRGVAVLQERKKGASVAHFMDARKAVKENRETFRRTAFKSARKKSAHLIVDNEVPLLVRENWLPTEPIPLENVELQFKPDPGVKISLSTRKLPSYSGGKYKKYSDAIADLDKPKVFEDRLQYRLIEIEGTRLSFSDKKHSYFDKINYGEYLMHELSHDKLGRWGIPGRSNRRRLLRHVQKPADYVVLTGISTLTLLHDGKDLRIIMHRRGKSETAYAMGTYHVIPAGEFQPSCLATASFREDFNLWKNIMREYAEELLCMDEYDGSGTVPFNYNVEPFNLLEGERAANNIKAFYLGIGLDVITFQGEILTAVVFKEDTFKKVFPKVLDENREGKIITDKDRWGREFTQEEYDSYQDANVLATGEAILNIAWKNRQFFKACFD